MNGIGNSVFMQKQTLCTMPLLKMCTAMNAKVCYKSIFSTLVYYKTSDHQLIFQQKSGIYFIQEGGLGADTDTYGSNTLRIIIP